MKTRTFAVGYLASLLLSSSGIVYAGPGGPGGCRPINSVPTTITTSGTYCFSRDLSTSINGSMDAAIRIEADDVILDLRGHVLDGSPADIATTQAQGILAEDRQNITVRNGTVRGFETAIRLQDTTAPRDDTGGHLVTNMRAEGSAAFGIHVSGRGNRVVNNLVLNTGGGLLGPGSGYEMSGISFTGPDSRIVGNDIINVHNTSEESAWGVATGGDGVSTGSIVEGNRISNLSATVAPYGVIGIGPDGYGYTSDGMVIVGNTITNGTPAGTDGWGIHLNSNALCRDNTILRFPMGIVGGCTDGGGNFHSP